MFLGLDQIFSRFGQNSHKDESSEENIDDRNIFKMFLLTFYILYFTFAFFFAFVISDNTLRISKLKKPHQ